MLTCLTGCDVFIPACSRVDTSVRERGETEVQGLYSPYTNTLVCCLFLSLMAPLPVGVSEIGFKQMSAATN